MQIEVREEQSWKAQLAISESVEPGAKLTVDKARHLAKQFKPTVLADRGMQIDKSAVQLQKAPFSMYEN
jgi:hypothetical protein